VFTVRKQKEVLTNTRLLTYDIRVRRSTSNKVRSLSFLDKEALGVVVSNLVASLTKGSKVIYYRSKNKKIKSKRDISTYRIIRAIDFLEKEGMVNNVIGKSAKDNQFRVPSYLLPTGMFLEWWVDTRVVKQIEEDYMKDYPVIELRDEFKNSLPYRLNNDIAETIATVKELNKLLDSFEIKDKNDEPLINFYCRVFTNSFDKGGRFYKADILNLSNKTDNSRLDVTIGGEKVVEVDYVSLQFRVAAAIEQMYPEDVPMDMYSEILEDPTNKVDREIVKHAVTVLFNCKDEGTAMKAIQSKINSLTKEEKENYTLGNARSVYCLFKDEYYQFTHLFCREDSYGLTLQNLDSNLANNILKKMIDKGIPCLPVHDSFVVRQSDIDTLYELMGDEFRNMFDVNWVVPVTTKWKEDGEIKSKNILL
jgi:hypothetical protein